MGRDDIVWFLAASLRLDSMVHTADGDEQARQWLAACKSYGQVNVNNSGVCSPPFGPDNYNIDFKFELLNPVKGPHKNTKRTGG